jgi:hypothetical protein
VNSSSFLVHSSSIQLLSCYKVNNGHLSVLPVWSSSARMFTPSYHITVRCFVFGRGWTWRSWRTGLLGVVKWWGVDPHLLGTSEWRGQLYLRGHLTKHDAVAAQVTRSYPTVWKFFRPKTVHCTTNLSCKQHLKYSMRSIFRLKSHVGACFSAQ